jgi:subtilisin family serine protease
MPELRFGGKGGRKFELVDGDEYLVVRTEGRRELKRAPLTGAARRALDGYAVVAAFERAGVEILRAVDPRGAKSRRDAARRTLKKDAAVRFAGRVLVAKQGRRPFVYTENLFVKFADDAKPAYVKRTLAAHGLKIKRALGFAKNAFFVEAPEGCGRTVFETAAKLLDDPSVELCHPEIVTEARRRDVFPGQWHLKKMTVGSRTIDAHVDVEGAWALTRGEGTTIAIVDDGVDLLHGEFSSAGKIVAPRDVTYDDDDPRPGNRNNHGTACAGVACADGRFGASGVAPAARLLPVRLVSALGSVNEAEAFQWAADRGADVISCSWGPYDGDWWDPNDPLHTTFQPIPDHTRLAIDYATTHGRNGRGCVVCFAAGNGNESVDLDGYASRPNVVAVAACDYRGKKSAYSDFGAAVWCAFPSNSGNSGDPEIFTTDRRGAAGYNHGAEELGDEDGDYTNDFGGTSSACPGAAGVAALILSRNPNLRWDEVRDVLKRCADRIDTAGGAYDASGKSPKYGYGRLNAKRAVELAIPAAAPGAAATVAVEAAAALPIKDLKTTTLAVEVGEPRALRGLKVRVEIDHPWIGDLVLTLLPPAALGLPPVVLHDRTGGSTDNIKKTYDALTTPALAAAVGKPPTGAWTLTVADTARQDEGTLRLLRLELTV